MDFYRVSPKKTVISVHGSFEGVKWPQIKKLKKIEFNFTYWEVFLAALLCYANCGCVKNDKT